MKNKFSILAFVIVLFLGALACSITIPEGVVSPTRVRGSGDVVEEEREVSGVTAVRVANQGDLFIELGEDEKLVIKAEDNLIDKIESDMRGGELILSTRKGVNIRNTEPIRYYLTVRELDEISVSSSGDVDAPEFNAGRFSINISSSGDVNVDGLNVDRLKVKITSSGDVTVGELSADTLDVNISSSGNLTILDGEVEEQEINISSSGDYDGRNLDSQYADVRLSSSGNATLRVSDDLDGSISSSGDLYYIGNPSVDVRQSSSGDVIKLSD